MDKQIRGNCQGCGRLQAATKGTLAHHGYTVEHGYFNGTCYGAQELPLQVSRALLDKNVVGAKAHAQKLRDRADDIRFKRETPTEVITQEYRGKGRYCSEKPEIRTPWAELSVWDQDRWRRITVAKLEGNADGLERWAKDMLELADKVHGQPMIEVDKPGSEAKVIKAGDLVKVWGRTVEVTKVDFAVARGVGPGINGQNVKHIFWTDEKGSFKYPARYARKVV